MIQACIESWDAFYINYECYEYLEIDLGMNDLKKKKSYLCSVGH